MVSVGSCTSAASTSPAYGAPPIEEAAGPCGEIESDTECRCDGFYFPVPYSADAAGKEAYFYCPSASDGNPGSWQYYTGKVMVTPNITLYTAKNCAMCTDAGLP
jgi:hypothetical protein